MFGPFRRNGGPLTREAFESDLRREGFEVVHGGQNPGFTEALHAHDFDARIMVLGGEITVIRDNKAETFRAGDHCEIPTGCQHSAKVGPEGVACIVGKALPLSVCQLVCGDANVLQAAGAGQGVWIGLFLQRAGRGCLPLMTAACLAGRFD